MFRHVPSQAMGSFASGLSSYREYIIIITYVLKSCIGLRSITVKIFNVTVQWADTNLLQTSSKT